MSSEISVESVLTTARETITRAEYCFFITHGEGSQVNARLLQPFDPEEDLVIWFGVHAASRKIQDLQRSTRVTLAYQYLEENAYVVLLGEAQVVRDQDLQRRYWKEIWREYYPGGPTSADYTLIKFTPDRVEVINETREIATRPYGRAAAVVEKNPAQEQWGLANLTGDSR